MLYNRYNTSITYIHGIYPVTTVIVGILPISAVDYRLSADNAVIMGIYALYCLYLGI